MVSALSSRLRAFLSAAFLALATNGFTFSDSSIRRNTALYQFQGPGGDSRPLPPLDPRAAELLAELNLTASTEPKLAGVERGENILNLLTASVPLLFRAASGVFAQGYQVKVIPRDASQYTYLAYDEKQLQETTTSIVKPPNQPLILYEFESCPFCRKVREACSILSLTVTFRPCPKDSRRYRPYVKSQFGSRATFPYLEDPNTSVSMFESDDIIAYLFKVYGNGEVPWTLQKESPWVPLTAGLGVGLARFGAGGSYKSSNPPPLPLILWAYEGSPFCKVVRERLSELELEHTIIFTPRGSPNRQSLWELYGRFQVPFLQDPNTNVDLFESDAILEYLQKMYAVEDTPVKYI